MADAASNTADDAAAAARAADAMRLRKERREAKLKAGGSARLNKITGVGGGLQRDPIPAPFSDSPAAATPSSSTPDATPPQPAQQQQQQHADPEEVDISQHYYAPQTTSRRGAPQQPFADPANMSEAQLRQMMLGFDGSAPGAGGPQLPPGAEDDPMLKLLTQMMSGAAGGGGGGAGGSPFPGGASPFGPQGQQTPGEQQPADRYSAVWRLLHTAVALGLGLYIALWTSFGGTKGERQRSKLSRDSWTSDGTVAEPFDSRRFFYFFATAEAVLLTTRYFLDRARAPPAGLLWTVSSFLPPPFRGYLEMVLRYGQIFSTVKSDVLVCIFVLGACSWIRSG